MEGLRLDQLAEALREAGIRQAFTPDVSRLTVRVWREIAKGGPVSPARVEQICPRPSAADRPRGTPQDVRTGPGWQRSGDRRAVTEPAFPPLYRQWHKACHVVRVGLPVSTRDAPADRRGFVPVPDHRRDHQVDHHAGGRDELPARQHRHFHRDPTTEHEWAGIGRGDLDDVLPPRPLLFIATGGAGVGCRTGAGDRYPHYRGSL